MNFRILKNLAAIAGLMFLISCGSGEKEGTGGFSTGSLPINNNSTTESAPLIKATLISFQAGSYQGNIPNASVLVQDPLTKSDITTAIVTINNTVLTYNPAAGHNAYEGNVEVAPGAGVALTVTVRDKSYTASATQFISFPATTLPVDGIWYSGIPRKIAWSQGSPETNAVYNLAILDVNDPYGSTVWPKNKNNEYLVIPAPATTYILGNNYYDQFPSGGDRLLLTAIVRGVPISQASYNSIFIIAGCSTTPITTSDATLQSITITPANPTMAWGSTQQFTATGIFSDNNAIDFTSQAYWNSGIPNDSSVPGVLKAQTAGLESISTYVAASIFGKTGSTSVHVMPPKLLSIQINPNNRTIAPNTTQHFSATGRYENSSVDITSQVNWKSSNSGVAPLSNDANGRIQTKVVSTGATVISATLNDTTATTTLNIANTIPGSGRYVYLQSDLGHLDGAGNTYSFTDANAQFELSVTNNYISVSVTDNQRNSAWGNFVVPSTVGQPRVGYYSNPASFDYFSGGLFWGINGSGCNDVGWFAIDNISYNNGKLVGIDLRFEDQCYYASSPSLYGWIHWTQ